MPDEAAELARLIKVTEVINDELARQGVLEMLDDAGFEPMKLAKVVIKAADGDVVPLRRRPF
jgi:hypothetical protein